MRHRKRRETFDYFTELIHMLQIEKEAVGDLYELVDHYSVSRIQLCKNKLDDKKKQVNVIKNDMMLYLWNDFLPPVERGDLLNYITQLSNVMYSLTNIVVTMENYPVSFLKGMMSNIIIAMEVVIDVTIEMLREMKNFKKSKVLKIRMEECRKKVVEGMDVYKKGIRQITRNAEVTKDFFYQIKIYDTTHSFFERMFGIIDLTEVLKYRNG